MYLVSVSTYTEPVCPPEEYYPNYEIFLHYSTYCWLETSCCLLSAQHKHCKDSKKATTENDKSTGNELLPTSSLWFTLKKKKRICFTCFPLVEIRKLNVLYIIANTSCHPFSLLFHVWFCFVYVWLLWCKPS